jgi:hypothetical protein
MFGLCCCKELEKLTKTLREIFIKPSSSVLIFRTLEGDTYMPLKVVITDKPGVAKYQEFNATGVAVPPLGSIAYASDNTSVATVDPSTGQLAYVGVGSCNIAGADSGVSGGLPASDSLTVVAAVDNTPVTSTMTLTPGA